jgi:hypothetical protein
MITGGTLVGGTEGTIRNFQFVFEPIATPMGPDEIAQ